MSGTTVKRCTCPPLYDANGRRKACSKRHGSWYYVLDLEPDASHPKRRQLKKGGFPTQAAAQAALVALQVEISTGVGTVDRRITVAAYLHDWLEQRTADLRPTTIREYRRHIDAYILPAIGTTKLHQLRAHHIRDLLAGLEAVGSGSQAAVARKVHSTLRSALGEAVRLELIANNPARNVRPPRATRTKVDPWTPEELGAFLDHVAGHELGPCFELTALTGLRRGEVLGLRWADVDFAKRQITVIQQVVQLNGHAHPCECGSEHRGIRISAPKTANGQGRRIDLGEAAVGALLAHRVAQESQRQVWGPAYTDHGLVFAREDGNPRDPERVTKVFSRLVADAGLRPARLHDLRHCRASMLIDAGADLSMVSKMLGHSTYGFTADTYTHLLAGVGHRAAEAADALIPRKLRDQSVTNEPTTTTLKRTDDRGEPALTCDDVGGPPGDRTPNPRIKSPLLCQLS